MFESICVVGERGQITIPKSIREIGGIKSKDKVIVKMENNKVVVEKLAGKKEKEKLMKEYYEKYAKVHKQINEEWKETDNELNRYLK